ncbi:MAG: nitroreductase family deazaflavin-dependent oxidoreductase [Acidimicrobiia bacterium]|nr:nitroreductase family deazaflavin-dependent oxidoreductase [Acidimicrobiia bacterium]
MRMPLWWGKVNKRVFNPIVLRRGKSPTLTHVGRKSGKEFVTPLDAYEADGGYLFMLVYGPKSDWVRNILASGSATLRKEGETYDLVNPRVIDKAAAAELLQKELKIPGYVEIDEFLHMDLAG